ncbi:hypothetical protein [Streptomyces sp. DH24]|uniref:hypothetical protein n=1 Tax=Streptomyces sp. DH24 TaxID=3040123 RepID=UPI00244329A1|nr:hypothetical protein [Streptomyces sp. DH24]MDG9719551.1 hypothetical protein [Streptomyces sp. DH24]
MSTPQSVEPQYTLQTAAARIDELRLRESLAGGGADAERLDRAELLELLALGEAVARKAARGRRLTVRAAREAGASWSQIAAALGTSEQAAREAHTHRTDARQAPPGRPGELGPDAGGTAADRAAEGRPDEA